ncbi:striatin-interacting protein 1 homolog [Diachasma alloeum]|uniref:striatin-interacting protein 1 homolog n=1 Tax=Diachasma alloeum TaxID=454923 RepID=UPI00073838E2|nr:striatin-interacting protein 1 homolog [Diachasma alloeum]XP_015112693.1 striatin-interacting protein 1 homolog [Diachasma alloeum]XP_015112694.1 striatin-interacting protein 1 homolog [Diachasma alloeum]
MADDNYYQQPSPKADDGLVFHSDYSGALTDADQRMGLRDSNGNGNQTQPKVMDIFHRLAECHIEGIECADLDFEYDDTDTHTNEIAELYSYTEQYELALNLKAFEDLMESYKLRPWWQNLQQPQQKSVILKLLDQLEVSNKHSRMKAARCILYLVQGCWAEVQSDKEQQDWTRTNVMMLYEAGIFSAFVELLNIEIENSTAASSAMRKLAVSLADSVDLRIILSVLYIITEVMREESKSLESTPYKDNVLNFKEELIQVYGEDLLIVKLLVMVTSFCSGSAPHFPMKKVLLLLWKLILVSLGGIDELRRLKKLYREEAGLEPPQEDTIEVARTMRASSPPTSAADLLETQAMGSRKGNSNKRPFRGSLMKQSSLDEPALAMENEYGKEGESGGNEGDVEVIECVRMVPMSQIPMYCERQLELRPSTPELTKTRGLPWTPKVRQKDVAAFLDSSRLKFVGYKLEGDVESLVGLPHPIHEGVNTLKRHMYTSLAEVQIQKEEEISRNPMSTPEPPLRQTPTEILYQAILPNLPQYMIALLKILLAAAPTSKAKTDSINIMADVLPEEMPMTVLQSMKLGIDVNRHKEIIVKAISAILLLLLKHFKLNHIYQFEFMSQHLVFANCIPLVLKFLNQNILAYIEAKNMIPILDFPICVIGDQPELTIESLEIGDSQTYSWRNVFSCINLLRILNKLTKWKHSRIMMLVVFKSAPILKRTLKVRNAMMQLYVLKLLKMQTKYLGRQWRKTNMKTISVIYAKVRHRLNDDWAYGNDLEARPWDFQAEECALRACVDQFNNRRYLNTIKDEQLDPVDTSIVSVLGANIELTDEFKQHYELWLQQEVFQTQIDWDKLLKIENHDI